MSDETNVTPNVTYVYNTTNGASASGGPMFILLYIQCAMFLLNEWLQLSMELWQLVFPTFIVMATFIVGMLNQKDVL